MDFLKTKEYLLEYTFFFALINSFKDLLGDKAESSDSLSVFEHWCLDRKFREVLQQMGMAGDAAYYKTEIFKCLIPTADITIKNLSISEKALYLVSEIFDNTNNWKALGVNMYEDVVWYGKENAEELFGMAEVFYSICGGKRTTKYSAASWDKELVELEKVTRLIALAHNESGYQKARQSHLIPGEGVL